MILADTRLCACGHDKSFHMYLARQPDKGEPELSEGPCDHRGRDGVKCECEGFQEEEDVVDA